jgi:hypothetical protein
MPLLVATAAWGARFRGAAAIRWGPVLAPSPETRAGWIRHHRDRIWLGKEGSAMDKLTMAPSADKSTTLPMVPDLWDPYNFESTSATLPGCAQDVGRHPTLDPMILEAALLYDPMITEVEVDRWR